MKIFELINFPPACSILKCNNKSTTQHNIFARIYDHKAAQHRRLLQSNPIIKTWSLLFKMLDMQYFLDTRYWHLKRSFTQILYTIYSFCMQDVCTAGFAQEELVLCPGQAQFPSWAQAESDQSKGKNHTLLPQPAISSSICIAMLRAAIPSGFPRPNTFRQTLLTCLAPWPFTIWFWRQISPPSRELHSGSCQL